MLPWIVVVFGLYLTTDGSGLLDGFISDAGPPAWSIPQYTRWPRIQEMEPRILPGPRGCCEWHGTHQRMLFGATEKAPGLGGNARANGVFSPMQAMELVLVVDRESVNENVVSSKPSLTSSFLPHDTPLRHSGGLTCVGLSAASRHRRWRAPGTCASRRSSASHSARVPR